AHYMLWLAPSPVAPRCTSTCTSGGLAARSSTGRHVCENANHLLRAVVGWRGTHHDPCRQLCLGRGALFAIDVGAASMLFRAGVGANLGAITATDGTFQRTTANWHQNTCANRISRRLSADHDERLFGTRRIVPPSA